MSPIIYTPHNCKPPEGFQRAGTLWQCDICDATWSAYSPYIGGGWRKIDEPRKDQCLAESIERLNTHPTTPTVTPDMVELVLNEYKEHANIGRLDNAWWCARCPDPIPQGLTPAGHARSMAAAALQDALTKAGDTRG